VLSVILIDKIEASGTAAVIAVIYAIYYPLWARFPAHVETHSLLSELMLIEYLNALKVFLLNQ
jgi:hypothetical protein